MDEEPADTLGSLSNSLFAGCANLPSAEMKVKPGLKVLDQCPTLRSHNMSVSRQSYQNVRAWFWIARTDCLFPWLLTGSYGESSGEREVDAPVRRHYTVTLLVYVIAEVMKDRLAGSGPGVQPNRARIQGLTGCGSQHVPSASGVSSLTSVLK